jgi:hypothetical protein
MIKLNKVTLQEINQFIENIYIYNVTDGRREKQRNMCYKLMAETQFETVNWRISPKWTKWGKHFQIEHACEIHSPIWGK